MLTNKERKAARLAMKARLLLEKEQRAHQEKQLKQRAKGERKRLKELQRIYETRAIQCLYCFSTVAVEHDHIAIPRSATCSCGHIACIRDNDDYLRLYTDDPRQALYVRAFVQYDPQVRQLQTLHTEPITYLKGTPYVNYTAIAATPPITTPQTTRTLYQIGKKLSKFVKEHT